MYYMTEWNHLQRDFFLCGKTTLVRSFVIDFFKVKKVDVALGLRAVFCRLLLLPAVVQSFFIRWPFSFVLFWKAKQSCFTCRSKKEALIFMTSIDFVFLKEGPRNIDPPFRLEPS